MREGLIAYSDAVTITVAVAAFFAVLALLAFARVLLRKGPPPPRRFRIGIFVERDDMSGYEDEEDDGSISATFPKG
jgi:hypothetical protein